MVQFKMKKVSSYKVPHYSWTDKSKAAAVEKYFSLLEENMTNNTKQEQPHEEVAEFINTTYPSDKAQVTGTAIRNLLSSEGALKGYRWTAKEEGELNQLFSSTSLVIQANSKEEAYRSIAKKFLGRTGKAVQYKVELMGFCLKGSKKRGYWFGKKESNSNKPKQGRRNWTEGDLEKARTMFEALSGRKGGNLSQTAIFKKIAEEISQTGVPVKGGSVRKMLEKKGANGKKGVAPQSKKKP